MGVAILAPVPAELIGSAVATCTETGRVAFGTNAFEVFKAAENIYGAPLPVLIYPTIHYGDPEKVSRPGYAPFKATYFQLKRANNRGRHPDAFIRPAMTISGPSPDTPWLYFWEVTDLKRLPKAQHVAVSSLTAEGQTKPFPNGYVPHGPIIVKAGFL